MTAVILTAVGLAALNVALAFVLGAVYWRNHREIRSSFTLGLLLFALFLVVHNALVVYHWYTMMGGYSITEEWYLLVEEVLQTAAVGALVVATMR